MTNVDMGTYVYISPRGLLINPVANGYPIAIASAINFSTTLETSLVTFQVT